MKYTAKKDTTVGDLLKIHYAGASNSTLKNYFKTGRLRLNNQAVKVPATPVKTGDVLEVLAESERPEKKHPFGIIYEDDAILVVEKEAGILTSGEGITRRPTLHKLVSDYLEKKSKGKVKAFVVHRLDKEVTGMLLFAKSAEIVYKLHQNWKKYTKKYLALSTFTPEKPSGTVDTWLIERSLRMCVIPAEIPGAVRAISHYKWLRFEKKNSLFEVTLETGKKNQIRVHMAQIGCPIIGDEKYGDLPKQKTQVRLMAYSLEIIHPVTGKQMKWELEPKAEFLRA